MKTRVSEILAGKGHDVWTVSPESVVYDAIEMMADKSVGALPVVSDSLVGIISERDYARKVILQGLSSKDVKISEVMTRDVVSVSQDHTVKECMVLMNEKGIRHLPVLNDEELIGMVSVRDLVDCIIEEQVATIGNLQSYTRSFLLIGLAIVMTVVLLWIAS
jgi:CBS domain-containing protein